MKSCYFEPLGSIKITSSYQEFRIKGDILHRNDINWDMKLTSNYPEKIVIRYQINEILLYVQCM